jgi:hypothetical protein
MLERIIKEFESLVSGNPDLSIGVCIATTANVNNPPLYIGRQRRAGRFAMANFVLGDSSWVRPIVETFDEVADVFFIDSERKNAELNLMEIASGYIRYTPVIYFRPNAMTVQALEAWLTVKCSDMHKKCVAVFGPGNIGSKAALMLAERGAEVRLVSRSFERAAHLAEVLNSIASANGTVVPCVSPYDAAQGAHVVLGCTPGIPAIDAAVIELVEAGALLIDVGNGTFHYEAIEAAGRRDMPILCLTPDAGFAALVEAITFAQNQLANLRSRVLPCGIRAITPGIFGRKGDILVNSLEKDFFSIYGVCDGRGSLLPQELAQHYIDKVLSDDQK